MSSYFYTLIVTSVCGAICTMLAWGGFEKYIKYVASLICVCLIISPLRDIDFSIFTESADRETAVELPENPEDIYSLTAEMTEQKTEEYISQIVFNKFGIKTVSTDIKMNWESERDAVIESIKIGFSKEDMQYSAEAQSFLADALGGEVVIFEG